jgi:hypothetical protein
MSKKKYGLRTVVYDDTNPEVAQEKQDLSDWEIMRKLDDSDLQKELDETELSAIKNRNFKYDKYVGAFVNGLGEKAKSAADAIAKNYKVRKAASKIIKGQDLNRFMTAPDYDTYARPFQTALKNVQTKKIPTAPNTSNNNFVNPGAAMEEKIEPKTIKTTDDIIFENLLRKEKIQKAQQDDEVNNQGLGTLKKYI